MNLLNHKLETVKCEKNRELPIIDITMKPYADDDYQIRYVDVVMGLSCPEVKANDSLVWLWTNIASIPVAEFDEKGIIAVDEAGPLHLKVTDGIGTMGFPARFWSPARDTSGDVALQYRFFPRVVPKDYRFRPYYDFRNESYGATGSGVTTLVSPEAGQYLIKFHWDLSEMPEDSVGVAVKGEGDLVYEGDPESYQFTMYAVGKVKKAGSKDGRFRIYWLNEPLPDREKIVHDIPLILEGMSRQFDDPNASYSVFFRKDPFDKSNGATAFSYGFIYGYSDAMTINWDRAKDIFAHEFVHTWPRLADREGKDGEGYWYHEGTAEWYSIKVLRDLGLTTQEEMAQQITWRSINYYANEFNRTSNTDAFNLSWKERHAQWLPYGRGFFYLIDFDWKLKEKTCGKKSLDDIVLEILDINRSGREATIEDWERIVLRELGEEELQFYRELCEGKFVIEPRDEWFDGAFDFEWGEAYEPVRGTRTETYIWKAKD